MLILKYIVGAIACIALIGVVLAIMATIHVILLLWAEDEERNNHKQSEIWDLSMTKESSPGRARWRAE